MRSKAITKLIILAAVILQSSCQKEADSNNDTPETNSPKDSLTLISGIIGSGGQSNSFYSYNSLSKQLLTKFTPLGQQQDSTYFFYNSKKLMSHSLNVRNWGSSGSKYTVTIYEYDSQDRITNVYTKKDINPLNVSSLTNFTNIAELAYKDSILYDNKDRISKIFEKFYNGYYGELQSIFTLKYNFSNDSLLSEVVRTFPLTSTVYTMTFNTYDNKVNPLYRDLRNAPLSPEGFGEKLSLLPLNRHLLANFLCLSPNNCTNIAYSVSGGSGTNYGGILKYQYGSDSLPFRISQSDELSVGWYQYMKISK